MEFITASPTTMLANETSSHNILWSDEFDASMYAYMLLPLFGCVALAIHVRFYLLEDSFVSDSPLDPMEQNRIRFLKDVTLFSVLVLCEESAIWVYICMTPNFVSSEMQITMMIILFGGPPIVSILLLASWKEFPRFCCLSLLEFRKEILIKSGIDQESMNCNSITDLLFPIKYVLVHIAFVVGSLLMFISVGAFGIVLIIIISLVCLYILQYVLKVNSSGEASAVDLLQCIVIHLISFSIPEIVMVILNMNLIENEPLFWLTGTYVALVSLEGCFGIFYLVKWSTERCHQPKPLETVSATIDEATLNNGLQMSETFSSIGAIKSIKNGIAENEVQSSNATLVAGDVLNHNAQPSMQAGSSITANGFEGGSDDLECTICYTAGNKKKVIVSCGHMLCENCLKGLLEQTGSNLCPFCHQPITQTTDLYF